MKKAKCYALDFFAKNPRAFARIHFLTMYGLDALIAHTQHTQHTDNDKKPVLLHVLQQLNESLWEYMLFVDCKQSRYSELRSIKEMRSGNWEKYVTAHIIYAIREYILHNTPINIDFDLSQVDELKSFNMVGWMSLFSKICNGEAIQIYSTELYKMCLAFPNDNAKQMYYNFNGV